MLFNIHLHKAYLIFFRYLLIALLGLGNAFLFYFIFTPQTIYPTYFILNTLYSTELLERTILIHLSQTYQINIIDACIAGAAYYLLLILNLATPLPVKKRIYSLLFSFTLLLIFNILRIIILSIMFVSNSLAFDFTHKFFWYVLSTIFVVVIWFLTVFLFKIKDIPVYTDINYIYRIIKKKKSKTVS